MIIFDFTFPELAPKLEFLFVVHPQLNNGCTLVSFVNIWLFKLLNTKWSVLQPLLSPGFPQGPVFFSAEGFQSCNQEDFFLGVSCQPPLIFFPSSAFRFLLLSSSFSLHCANDLGCRTWYRTAAAAAAALCSMLAHPGLDDCICLNSAATLAFSFSCSHFFLPLLSLMSSSL